MSISRIGILAPPRRAPLVAVHRLGHVRTGHVPVVRPLKRRQRPRRRSLPRHEARVAVLHMGVPRIPGGGRARHGAQNLLANDFADHARRNGARVLALRCRPRHVPCCSLLCRDLRAAGGCVTEPSVEVKRNTPRWLASPGTEEENGTDLLLHASPLVLVAVVERDVPAACCLLGDAQALDLLVQQVQAL